MRRLAITLPVLLLLVGVGFSGDDCLEKIKTSLSDAACSRFDFVLTTESQVFGSTDTTIGSAYLSNDGRYTVDLGADCFVNTGDLLYSYSRAQNQVTVEKTGSASLQEVSFLTHLDDYFECHPLTRNREYFLTKKEDAARSLPDSLWLFVDSTANRITRLDYYDDNEDFCRIIIDSHQTFPRCDTSALLPDFPDSVEYVKLF